MRRPFFDWDSEDWHDFERDIIVGVLTAFLIAHLIKRGRK